MFTDIVGYTALMGSDEDRAFEVLAKNREIHTKLIEQFKGILIKEMGDGMLVSFNLASEAVRCAIEIQEACREQDIPLKIGIHEGEMVFEGNDVHGDGVNIASRIQDDTEEGCIMISASVYRDIKNKADIQTEFVGEKSFKNVDEKIRIYQVECGEGGKIINDNKQNTGKPQISNSKKRKIVLVGFFVIIILSVLGWQFVKILRTDTENINSSEIKDKSIAVRPFWNESDNESNEYFVNGMCEDIRINLAKIADLRVLSRGSVEKYRDKKFSNVDIAKDLDVSYVLEGTVQRIENQLKIHVQLILGENEDHIWQDTYQKEINDAKEVFSIQHQIARSVAKQIEAEITSDEKQRIEKIPTNSFEAYNYYLRGR